MGISNRYNVYIANVAEYLQVLLSLFMNFIVPTTSEFIAI